jgi:hypothetical protein
MTLDQLETRLQQLEARWKASDALLHCVLPAIDPARRPVVMRQFQQYCHATEEKLGPDAESPEGKLHLRMLADEYTRLEGALQMIEEHEKKTKARGR